MPQNGNSFSNLLLHGSAIVLSLANANQRKKVNTWKEVLENKVPSQCNAPPNQDQGALILWGNVDKQNRM